MTPTEDIVCPLCGKSTPYNRFDCKFCGAPIGFPNVNKTKLQAERDALLKRYKDVIKQRKANGTEAIGTQFEDVISKKKKVIKNIDFEYLYQWVCDPDFELMPYAKLVDKGLRPPASPLDDTNRTIAEGILYGSYGRSINYGAISIDNLGLYSYGRFSVTIVDGIAKNKTSYLEFNSYQFADYYSFNEPLPYGYLAGWDDVFMLAAAKTVKKISQTTTEREFSSLILKSDGGRSNDEFIEAHIFGNLTADVIEEVRDTKKITKSKIDAHDLEEMKFRLGDRWKD